MVPKLISQSFSLGQVQLAWLFHLLAPRWKQDAQLWEMWVMDTLNLLKVVVRMEALV